MNFAPYRMIRWFRILMSRQIVAHNYMCSHMFCVHYLYWGEEKKKTLTTQMINGKWKKSERKKEQIKKSGKEE